LDTLSLSAEEELVKIAGDSHQAIQEMQFSKATL
jgi:hypothetical protein